MLTSSSSPLRWPVGSALALTSTFFETLGESSVRFSKQLSKDYDALNDLTSKQFKRIAKEEQKHDDVLEGLDAKLKKANFAYDKQRAKPGYNATGANGHPAVRAHEQFVPLLSQLTDDLARAKTGHGSAMSSKREYIVRETARMLTCMAELEFKRGCEKVRRTGAEIGPVMAIQALLGGDKMDKDGPSATGSILPTHWPPPLAEVDGLHLSEQTGAGTEKHVHPAYLGQPRQPSSQQHSDELIPPRRTSGGDQYSSVSSRRSSVTSGRVAPSPRLSATVSFTNMVASAADSPASRESARPDLGRPDWSANEPSVQRIPSAHAGDAPALQHRPRSGEHQQRPEDHNATILGRAVPFRAPLDANSFSPPQSSPHAPAYRESLGARQPNLSSGLQHMPSQRANVYTRYTDDQATAPALDSTSGSRQANSDLGWQSSGRFETVRRVTIPAGFVMDETEMSPDRPLIHVKASSASRQSGAASKAWAGREGFGNADDLVSKALDYGDHDDSASRNVNLDADGEPEKSSHASSHREDGSGSGASLARSASVESTASQQSFVARMKAKYAHDRDVRNAERVSTLCT